MRFPYFKLPNADPSAKFISVPWIPVTIKANDREQTFLMLVDSGADNCIFDKDIAEFLGIEISKGERVKTSGIGGNAKVYYFDDIYVNVGGIEVKTRCGFIDGNLIDGKIAGVLGRQGFLITLKFVLMKNLKRSN